MMLSKSAKRADLDRAHELLKSYINTVDEQRQELADGCPAVIHQLHAIRSELHAITDDAVRSGIKTNADAAAVIRLALISLDHDIDASDGPGERAIRAVLHFLEKKVYAS
jgi:tRNA(Ile2) C34 agmatinyltransferase TiaS